MKRIYITRKLPDSVMRSLQDFQFEIRMWEEEETPVPREVLEQEIVEADGLLCMLTDAIDASLMDRAKKLKIISNLAVGYNNINIQAAKQRNIMVTNTPGVLTETTADLTFSLLCATARRLVEASDYLKKGDWKTWSPMLMTGQDVYGATLGIIGMGRIGEALAKRARGFEMEVLYYSQSRKIDKEQKWQMSYVELDELLQRSDFVCVMTPYTPQTKDLISDRELKLMKKTAVLINTARGGIVNETALYEALVAGDIWAAGLDVFAEEPIRLDHPLLTLSNVTLLPHIGSASIKTRSAMAELAIENMIQGLHGEVPKCLVHA